MWIPEELQLLGNPHLTLSLRTLKKRDYDVSLGGFIKLSGET